MNEQMKRYIERTKATNKDYYMLRMSEIADLANEPDTVLIVCNVFDYGFAKGYRAALQQARLNTARTAARKAAAPITEAEYLQSSLLKKLANITDLKSLRLIKILIDQLIKNGSPED